MEVKKRIFILILSLTFLGSFIPARADVVRLTLDEAIDMAMTYNLDLQAKRKELGVAKEDIKIANRLQNPRVVGNFLIGKVRLGNSSQVGLDLPVEFMKRGPRKKVAKAKYSIAQNKIREYEHDLKIDVMRAYFEVLYLKSVVSIMNDRKLLFEEMANVAKTKSPNTDNYKIDVLQSDIRYKRLLIELNQAKANLLSAQFHLNKVINMEKTENMYDATETSLFADDLSILSISLLPYEIIEKIAMKYSYSLRIADFDIKRAEAEVSVAKSQRIPNFNVGGGFAWQATYRGQGDNWPGAFVGASLDVPMLYFYGPDVRKANLILEKSKMDKASFENKLKIALKQDYNNFKYAKENMEYYREIMQESRDILEMSKERFSRGKTTFLNLLIIENSHQQTLQEYLKAMGLYYSAYLNLMHNTGHDVLLQEEIF
ncbi:MAG: TolC family protein [Fusobacterium sp.]|nr:TolC family protein [Fusobacterium sp.]